MIRREFDRSWAASPTLTALGALMLVTLGFNLIGLAIDPRITVAGAGFGGLMLGPTPDQAASLRAGQPTPTVGAHTVGAPDGGPGYPVMHWSRDRGDLRVPHFVGLHALQALPLLFLVIRRLSRTPSTRTAIALTASAGYAAVVGLLLRQALQGEPLLGKW